ncbi:MAG: LptF/LptG family permease [Verrucomicrobiota bacterium]
MRLIDRYLLREFLLVFNYCFNGFLVLWVAFDLMNELHGLQEKHLTSLEIVQLYILRLPEFLPIALPIALLLALLYSLSNHARYNEVTAIRAAGVSLWRLSAPYLGVGLIAGAVLFGVNEFCAPVTADLAEQLLGKHAALQTRPDDPKQAKKLFFFNARENRSWFIGHYDVATGEMQQPVVDWTLPDGSHRKLSAERGVRTNGIWTFYHVREFRAGSSTNSYPVPLPQTNMLAMPDFNETLPEIRSEISINKRWENQARSRRADISIGQIWNYLRLHPKPDPAHKAWLETKLQGRLAGPCTCLVVVLIAVPFAAGSGRRNVFVGVAASIFIFFAYYILQQVGFAYGEAGRIPAWIAAWFPNLVFAAAGLWLMARVR